MENELYTKGLLDGKVGWKYLRVESDFASELLGQASHRERGYRSRVFLRSCF